VAVCILDPQPGERVLDMCAAPGSKTSQMAAHMNNEGTIAAIDAIRKRCYKLRSVLKLLGVTNATVTLLDARRYRNDGELFDKILVDAPCSSEGRFLNNVPRTYAYWSTRKVKEMVRKQRGILIHAARLLKPGGVLVYSTCTFSPEENEGVINWLLKKVKTAVKIDSIKADSVLTYSPLQEWQGTVYNKRVQNCARVLPTKKMEGFFIAKITKEGTVPPVDKF